jgi:hypothetical protein
MICEKRGGNLLAPWCNGKDVKRVQMRSQATGPGGPNKFEGPIYAMCAGCRKANQGTIKIVKESQSA